MVNETLSKNSGLDSLNALSKQNITKRKERLANRPKISLRCTKVTNSLSEVAIEKHYVALMTSLNFSRPSEKTVASFRNLPRNEQEDLICRLEAKARAEHKRRVEGRAK